MNADKLIQYSLPENENKDNLNLNLMRVRVEAIDFDWLFENNHALKLLKMLLHQERTTIFS